MKRIAILFLFAFVFTSLTYGEETMCKNKDGYKPSKQELNAILDNHKTWLENQDASDNQHLYANLCNMDLEGADLSAKNLRSANLTNADLKKAKLVGTNLWEAKLVKANLRDANLTNVNLLNADLSDATLVNTNLTDAKLWGAILTGAQYEPSIKNIPVLDSLVDNKTLDEVWYQNPRGLIALREGYLKNGQTEEANKITRLIKHRSIELKFEGDYFGKIDGLFNLVFFEWTTDWGVEPGRSLKILLFGIILFFCFYFISLLKSDEDAGIWKKRPPNNDRFSDIDKPEKEHIIPPGFWSAVIVAFYFSLLSAFHFGWKDLNVGSWIHRMQTKEYTLRATGWVRTVAGVQSLISVYLIAIWVLTYFGRPFD